MQMSVKQRNSIVSYVPVTRKESYSTASRFRSSSTLSSEAAANGGETNVHNVDSKASTAMLPPVMVSELGCAWREARTRSNIKHSQRASMNIR